ncbi:MULTISPECIES: hypothetical protein [Bacillaceae]|jgi:predicted Zn-ribbon and HTH transcriptional regulator|uniref:hypothetical protein n=1 Tax=Bacillaceae TaxID=186817 RepID=UPI00203D57FD|nr:MULTISPECIES: hypothetical protein [Bacillaceae]MCM3055929.1 hypothetical protein [Caldibacillus thermoamylovorans]MEC5271206.1 hypothetical protein [Caldifermentibacillus hisashii]
MSDQIIISLLIGGLIINLTTMILVIILLKKIKRKIMENVENGIAEIAGTNETKDSAVLGVVFCRNCGQQFDSLKTVCPHCKTPR